MKRFLVFVFFLSFFIQLQAAKAPKDTVLFTYGNHKVTVREFYNGFMKSVHKESDITTQDVDEYLELYKKFRLKVQNAYDLGLDTTPDFKSELAGYRKQIAKQFLMDAQVNEQLVLEAYERMKFDIKASHILIFARPDSSPEDTLKAYNKLMDVRKKIASGELTFEKAALEFSEDPSAADNQGNLGFFSAFEMIYEFENMAYNTPVGGLSPVFRTEFGYHILKVNDKRPTSGEVTVKQIKIELNPGADSEEIEAKRKKINEVHKLLEGGEKFEYLVHQYSEDAQSVRMNGELPPFSMTSSRYDENFKKTAFSLQKDGDFSAPIQTGKGFYILQRVKLAPLDSLEKMRSTILRKIGRDSRQYRNTLAVYKRAQKTYKYSEYKKALAIINTYFDSGIIEGLVSANKLASQNPKLKNKVLFSLKGIKRNYTLDSFAQWVELVQRPSNSKSLSTILKNYYESYKIQMVMGYYEDDLENTNQRFASLFKDYKEGILLFSLMDKKVWTKSVEDSVGLKSYFQQNRDKFRFADRYDITYYKCINQDVAEQLKALLNSGQSSDSALIKLNKLNPLAVSNPFQGKFEQGENAYADMVFQNFKLGESVSGNTTHYEIYKDPKTHNYILVLVHGFIPEGPKELMDDRGEVMSAYQGYLEENWLSELMTEYPIVVDQKAFEAIKSQMIGK